MPSPDYNEPYELLSPEGRNVHRALASLMEELEAVGYYHERAETTDDEGLRRILLHNRDEEIEHSAMVLEWLRRTIPAFDEQLRTYLFTTADITSVEEEGEGGAEDNDAPAAGSNPSLGIGKPGKGK